MGIEKNNFCSSSSDKKFNIKAEIASLTLIILFAFSIRTCIFELFYVPTGSMHATILEGDYVFATKYNYGYSIYSVPFNPDLFEGRIFASQPERGDIIVMRPPHKMHLRYIKRLIGMPGETIQIINDITYINDTPIERIKVGQYISESGEMYIKYKETLPNKSSFFSYKTKYIHDIYQDHSNYGPYTIPDGQYFFIGDNRDQSGDSRYQLGTVPFRNLIAKAHGTFISIKEPLGKSGISVTQQIKRLWTWIASIRINRFFHSFYL